MLKNTLERFARAGAAVWPIRSTVHFARWFENWREVLAAYRKRQTIPTLRLRNGMSIAHASADDPIFLFKEIFIDKCYAGNNFYAPSPQDTIIDIGANVGFAAIYFSGQAPGIRIHCFEPARSTRERLMLNIENNKLQATVTIHDAAVSDRQGLATLFAGAHSGHGSLHSSNQVTAENGQQTRMITLADALKLAGGGTIDLLKIDAEGSEVEILTANPSKDLSQVRRVALEYHETIRPGSLSVVRGALNAGGLSEQVVIRGGCDGGIGIVKASRPEHPTY